MIKRLYQAVVPRPAREEVYQFIERIEWIWHVGNSVECPCCGATWRKFLPHGRPLRYNSRCARCGSLERHRLIYSYLETKLQPGRYLHVAPEAVLGSFLRKRAKAYLSIDLEHPGVDLHGDLTCLPLADNSFDFVLCVHVLEHIPDDTAAMRELRRVLKPSGFAILMVPMSARPVTYEDFSVTSPAERRKHFGQEDHVRWYGADYVQRLEKSGFSVEVTRAGDPVRNGLRDDEDLYICRK
jgi:SAM-dependent methyltransferase